MIVKSVHRSRGFTLSVFVAVMLACGVREDEFDCENAYSHLQQCCAAVALPAITCRYEAGGCEEGPTYPDLDIPTSDCIRSLSCDVLRASGICEGVSELRSESRASSGAPFTCPGHPVSLVMPTGDSGGLPIDAAEDDDVTTITAEAAPLDADNAVDAAGMEAADDAEMNAGNDAESDGEAPDAKHDHPVP
jgi:hypothetical protein